MPENNAAAFNLPDDLTGLTDNELAALSEQANADFDAIYAAEGGPQASDLARATELADAIEHLGAEADRRVQSATEAQAQFDAQLRRVAERRAAPAFDANAEPDAGTDPDPAGDSGDAPEEPAQPQTEQDPALVADARPKGGTRTGPRELGGVNPQRGRLNASLRAAQANAPNPRVPNAGSDLVITAAAATAGAPIGHKFGDLDTLSKAVTSYARGMAVSRGNPSYVPFASIQSRYPNVLGENTDPKVVEDTLKELTNPDVLVAAGGWCAPSEIRYNFFNVACQERTALIDLPSIGIDRGGIKFPVSPSMADVFSNPSALAPFGATFSNTSVPWLWSETDDIAAVTGTGTKPCIRVPCASFSEARLDCYGWCLTAGNLTDSAYPEATRNFLSMLMAAEIRVANLRYISQIASLSTLSTPASGIGAAGAGVAAPLLGAVEMAAWDYRTKFGMCDSDVLEVILPAWAKGAVRSDLAKRTGQDLESMAVTDQMIADWLDARGVRVQFVGEYQVRTSGLPGFASAALTAWPTAVEFMIYAAGTFVRGDGMSLDLGVVRDSTLNAKNDHTAGWTESCHLIAKFGHEGRRYIVNICTDGTTGAADLTACGL